MSTSAAAKKQIVSNTSALARNMRELVFGQDEAIDKIVPYITMYEAILNAPGKPIGSFLLLGPTGTGKTHLTQSLATCLHGSPLVLRIDCGEFQMEHEVAKLIGAPPGFQGHRETVPMLTQAKLTGVTSQDSNISVVLFDEIEKAAGSLERLLLGILDRATLKLGDNTTVDFSRSLIFFTSNVGSRDLTRRHRRVGFGYGGGKSIAQAVSNAQEKAFLAEFLNRIDERITFSSLGSSEIERILTRQEMGFTERINLRPDSKRFRVEYTSAARKFLCERGLSEKWGAREMKRIFQREVVQRVANFISQHGIDSRDTLVVDYKGGEIVLERKAK